MSDRRWIQTFSGRQFYPLTPRAEDVDIIDIAHALGNKCRYNGHSRSFYSVAEHSVRVAKLLGGDLSLSEADATKLARYGLLHDAAEAYLVDLPSPLKSDPRFAFLLELEETIASLVADVFDLPRGFHRNPLVKRADLVLLATEKRDLMAPPPAPWSELPDPLPLQVKPKTPEDATRAFLAQFLILFPTHQGSK